MASWDDKQDLALYVHWPFCASKCPYCDFNSHVVDAVNHERWAEALVRELNHMADLSERRGDVIHSIFFGGGTPSMMAPQTMAAVIDAARDIFTPSNDLEITMEANPTSVEAAKLADFAAAGANRLSMGIQALDDDALMFLGRAHSADEALGALDVARQYFSRVSADFIYARPDHKPEDWQDELRRILELGLDHYSLYQLTLEQGTAFWSKHQRGLLDVPPDDDARVLFDITRAMTEAAGLPFYEVSNHASPGEECRHNMIYWKAQDWLGIGPGAYGRFFKDEMRVEVRSRRDPAAWLDDVTAQGHAIDIKTDDRLTDYAHEAVMMGLRLKDGIDLDDIAKRAGRIKSWLDESRLQALVEEELIILDENKLSLTPKGAPLLNAILNAILRDEA